MFHRSDYLWSLFNRVWLHGVLILTKLVFFISQQQKIGCYSNDRLGHAYIQHHRPAWHQFSSHIVRCRQHGEVAYTQIERASLFLQLFFFCEKLVLATLIERSCTQHRQDLPAAASTCAAYICGCIRDERVRLIFFMLLAYTAVQSCNTHVNATRFKHIRLISQLLHLMMV